MGEIGAPEAELQQVHDVFLMDIVVLFWRTGSSLRSFSITSKAGWIGTDVKCALTSYDTIT